MLSNWYQAEQQASIQKGPSLHEVCHHRIRHRNRISNSRHGCHLMGSIILFPFASETYQVSATTSWGYSMHQQTIFSKRGCINKTNPSLSLRVTYFTFPSLPDLRQVLERSQDHAENTKNAGPIISLPMLRRTSNSSK